MTRKTTTSELEPALTLSEMISQALPRNASKAEEQNLLNAIVTALPDSYLSSLLSARLAQWFGYQAQNDLNTDIMDVVDSLSRDLHRATAETAKARSEAEDYGRQFEIAKAQHAQALEHAVETARLADEAARSYRDRYQDASEALCQMENTLALQDDIHAREMAAAKVEIMALKARLFDAGISAKS